MFVFFRDAVSTDFLFMNENVYPHRITEVSDTIESEKIKYMAEFTYSLDLSLIEPAWNALGKRVSQLTLPEPWKK